MIIKEAVGRQGYGMFLGSISKLIKHCKKEAKLYFPNSAHTPSLPFPLLRAVAVLVVVFRIFLIYFDLMVGISDVTNTFSFVISRHFFIINTGTKKTENSKSNLSTIIIGF